MLKRVLRKKHKQKAVYVVKAHTQNKFEFIVGIYSSKHSARRAAFKQSNENTSIKYCDIYEYVLDCDDQPSTKRVVFQMNCGSYIMYDEDCANEI